VKVTFKAKWSVAAVLALMLARPAFWSATGTTSAQESARPQSSTAATDSNPQAGQRDSAGRQLAKEEEREADPTAALRHSPTVKWISHKTGLSIDAVYWLCMILNFLVVFGTLWFFLRKIVPAAFRNRTEAIQRRLEEARKTSEDARRRLAEVEARLSRLDAEIEEMGREAEASAHRAEERIEAAGEDERRRIVDSAEQEIARAASAARRQLKAYAVELGVDLAEKRIRIEKDADQRLVRDFTLHLGRDGN
jgi:F-type H+-transporting ATPase subunit b